MALSLKEKEQIGRQEYSMIKDVTVWCENGFIKITWEWANSNVDSIRIYYKKSGGNGGGDGSPFTNEDIMQIPHNKAGRAQRPISSERGLYMFTIVPKMGDGSVGEKILVRNVMLGEAVQVPWFFFMQKGSTAIGFREFTGEVPADIAYVENGGYKCRLSYGISNDTVLVFPMEVDREKIKLCAKAPYDKVYRFVKRN